MISSTRSSKMGILSGFSTVPMARYLLLIHCACSLPASITSVVVDGDKKDELSALKHQKSNEKEAISPFNTRRCGLSDPNADEHEFIGMAREGEFPWLVSMQIKIMSGLDVASQKEAAQVKAKPTQKRYPGRKLEDLHFCGGSFISDKWIISAAHCFADDSIRSYLKSDKLKIVAGSNKVSSRSALNQNLTIARVYYHSKFDKSMPIGYDIALVELSEPVKFTKKRAQNEYGEQNAPFMNSICLPKRSAQYKFNETASVAGWGLSKARDLHSMPSKLLTTNILLANQTECADEYAKRRNSDKPRKRHDYICASYKTTRDACQSDSGGPLMQYVNKKAVVIGIVSFGISCASEGVPGVYSKTASFIDWIEDITKHGPKARVDFEMLESPASKKAREESGQLEGDEKQSQKQDRDDLESLPGEDGQDGDKDGDGLEEKRKKKKGVVEGDDSDEFKFYDQ